MTVENCENNQYECYIDDRKQKENSHYETTKEDYCHYIDSKSVQNEESKSKRYKASTVRIILSILIILLLVANAIVVAFLSKCFSLIVQCES